MRVALFTDTDDPSRNGVATSVRTLCRALQDAGVTVLVTSPSQEILPRRPRPGVRQLSSIPTGFADLRFPIVRINSEIARLARWRPDVVHVQTEGPIGLLGTIAAQRLDLPLVHTYHTDLVAYADAYRVPKLFLRMMDSCYRRKLEVPVVQRQARSRSRAELVESIAEVLLDPAEVVTIPTTALLRRRGVPAPAGKLRVVPTPAAAARRVDAATAAGFKRRFSIADSDRIVLSVGRIHSEKGVDLLLAGFKVLADQVDSVQLLLVGPAYGRRRIEKLLRILQIRDRVIIAGPLHPDDVAIAYKASDVFVFPSKTDSQGIVLDEAIASALPVVLADPDLFASHPLAVHMRLAGEGPKEFGAAILETLQEHLGRPALASSMTDTTTIENAFAESMLKVYRFAIDNKRSS